MGALFDDQQVDFAAAPQPAQEPRGWVCGKCGTDRLKAPCPHGHHAALTGQCPMVGTAQGASPQPQPAKRCMSCGFELPVTPKTEHVPGQMQEITLKKGGTPINTQSLYEQCVAYARAYSKPEKQKGRAAHLFKDFTGSWPPNSYSFSGVPESVEVTREVKNAITRNNIRRHKSPQRAYA